MKVVTFTLISLLFVSHLFSQTSSNSGSDTVHLYERLVISGGIGAGGVLSTNIINSGAVFPASLEAMLMENRHHYGIGITKELYLTPEALGKLALGKGNSNVTKFYFMYEWRMLPYFPVNVGWSSQIGYFAPSKELKSANNENEIESSAFANTGLILEVGLPAICLYVRPYIEYKNYSNSTFHHEIIGAVNFGLRYKVLTEEEKARRATKKQDRKLKRSR